MQDIRDMYGSISIHEALASLDVHQNAEGETYEKISIHEALASLDKTYRPWHGRRNDFDP